MSERRSDEATKRRSREYFRSRLYLCLVVAGLSGCSQVPNQWREDGPATTTSWESPTGADLKARFEPAEQRQRDWEASTVAAESGAVPHWPLYFEDPFEDKGHGRSDYRLGWEDYVGMLYGISRYHLNYLMLPVSAIVTPPWTVMESDGELSRQALGYDHDATRAGAEETQRSSSTGG